VPEVKTIVTSTNQLPVPQCTRAIPGDLQAN